MVKLQVLIATFGEEGLNRIARMTLPELKEVEYLISCQNPGNLPITIPAQLSRGDINVSFSDSVGLSRNRNLLLAQASAPFCVIADDDLSYTPEALLDVIKIFEEHPEVDIATFMYQNQSGGYEKAYPDVSFPLAKPTKGYYISSVEIAFRREKVEQPGARFNENFGVGSKKYGCGEEDLWIHELMKKGLKGYFFPILLATHHGASTGIRNISRPEVLRAQGVVIAVTYPLSSFPRIILKAYRASKATDKSFFQCFKPIFLGWMDAFFKKKSLSLR